MKKLLPILLLLLLTVAFAERISASYFTFDGETEKSDTDLYSGFSESLPKELKDTFDSILTPDDPTSDRAWTSVAESAVSAVCDRLTPTFAHLSLLLGVIVLCSVWRNISESITSGECAHGASLLVRCALTLTLLTTQIQMIEALEEFSRVVCSTAAAFVPAVTALHVASGNCTTALLTESGFASLIALAENVFALVILPAVKASFALSSVSAITGQSAPASVAAFLRTAAGLVCTLSMTLFSFVYSLRIKGGAAADGALMKTVRFAVGAFVSIVGGPVSESVDQMSASLSLIRNVCGSAAIALLLILILPTLTGIALNRATLFISKYACSTLSLGDEEKLFSEFGAASTLALAYAVSVTVAFVNCLAVFVRSASAF